MKVVRIIMHTYENEGIDDTYAFYAIVNKVDEDSINKMAEEYMWNRRVEKDWRVVSVEIVADEDDESIYGRYLMQEMEE